MTIQQLWKGAKIGRDSFQQWKHSRNVNPWKTATKECEFRSGWSFFISYKVFMFRIYGWIERLEGDIFLDE